MLLLVHKLLFLAGILLFGGDATYVYAVPCCYLHCTVARVKITDCPYVPCFFYARSSHVSPPQVLANRMRPFVLTPTVHSLLTAAVVKFFLTTRFEVGLYKVRVCMNLHSPSSPKRLRLHFYFGHFPWMMVSTSHHLC